MPKDYRNYIGVSSDNYSTRKTDKGVANLYDIVLDSKSLFTATGGSEYSIAGYGYNVFMSPGNLVVGAGGQVDMIIVAAGGGGGSGYYGGGGGGGAVIQGIGINLTAGTYPITIGTGGPAGVYPPGPNGGVSGGDSSFDTVTALGGGGGGAGPGGNQAHGDPGGNAGGGSAYTNTGTSLPMSIPVPYQPAGAWIIHQHIRGVAAGSPYGGDGADGPGSGFTGGTGIALPDFPYSIWAGGSIPSTRSNDPTGTKYGGGGGGYSYPGNSAGGAGGGGDGQPGNTSEPGVNGMGGGGGGSGNPRGTGGVGGNGIVIIRYPNA